MKQTSRTLSVLSIGLLLSTVIGSTTLFASQAQAAKAAPVGTLPLDEIRAFAEIFERIKNDYVEDVSDKELLKNAIRGMLSGLDPHSTYLDEDDYKDLQVGTRGEFGGLGIEVGMEDGFVKVIAPIDDTPAQRAGLQAGDLIIRLDDKSVKGMGLDEAVKLMRGKPGSKLKLTIVREGEDKPFTVSVERAVIKVTSVKGRTLEPGYGFVRISQFQSHTNEDMLKVIGKLKKENGGVLKGLVLDLRNNPGGVLNGAVSVSDAFLEKGLIVYTEGRVKNSQLTFKAGPDDVMDGAPIVVLVNGGSASASEIVAGALQDQGRAIIMGTRTFGKGSVQTIVPVNRTIALKLTTARYFTPDGRSIQAEGIKPDIVVENVRVEVPSTSDVKPLKESDLAGHLDNGKDTSKDSKAAKKKKKSASLAVKDYQVNEALNMLKGLSILSKLKKH